MTLCVELKGAFNETVNITSRGEQFVSRYIGTPRGVEDVDIPTFGAVLLVSDFMVVFAGNHSRIPQVETFQGPTFEASKSGDEWKCLLDVPETAKKGLVFRGYVRRIGRGGMLRVVKK